MSRAPRLRPPSYGPGLTVSWNSLRRAIDPTLIVADDSRLHCFFVGSAYQTNSRKAKRQRANLLGHAFTDDPSLKRWTVLTRDAPLLGVSTRAPDGVENVAVFHGLDYRYVMIYSEGLALQAEALAD